MRISNLSTTQNITRTIREMDQERLRLESQVSSGQKITLPEDDGMRMGRLIELDTEKSVLTQYQRNASYATEYLNAGHLNLDKLREVAARAQEIARVSGSGLSGPAMETYGFEVDQLIEEALNRINATHRKRSLFAGVDSKPNFAASDVKVGDRFQKTISFNGNYVGKSNPDGKYELNQGDQLLVNANGHEYVLTASVSGLATDVASAALASIINQDEGALNTIPRVTTSDYEVFVRGSKTPGQRDPNIKVSAETSDQGDLLLVAGVGQDFQVSGQYVTDFDPNFYFPEAIKAKLDAASIDQFGGKQYDELTSGDKESIANQVYAGTWDRDLLLGAVKVAGSSTAVMETPTDWKRLSRYAEGDLVYQDGSVWRSRIESNWNHKPGETDSKIWEKVPNGYSVDREDWTLSVTGADRREYWLAPDGKMFDLESEATSHTQQIILDQGYVTSSAQLQTETKRLVKPMTYAVPQFEAKGSESGNGLVSFDSRTQEFYLSSPQENGEVISGVYFKGNVSGDLASVGAQAGQANSSHSKGSVISRQGRYYLALENVASGQDVSAWEHLTADFPPASTFTFDSSQTLSLLKGSHILEPNSGQYYVATADTTIPAGTLKAALPQIAGLSPVSQSSDGQVFLLGENLPNEGKEKTHVPGRALSLKTGEFLHDPTDDLYYVANADLTLDASQSASFSPSGSASLRLVPARIIQQGTDWSASNTYDNGQIIHYNGRYYQANQSNWDNTSRDPNTLSDYVVLPSDEFIFESGEKVSNSAWRAIDKPLGHVMKFSVENDQLPTITFPSAGTSGTTAKASAVIDADGFIAGLRVVDPGRYFSGTSAQGKVLPPSFDNAKVLLPDGQKMDVKVLWEQDTSSPGTWTVAGFDFNSQTMPSGIPAGPQKGDFYSFATGSTSFVEHRDENGSIVDVSYNGSKTNSEFYIGHESKISSLLEAKGGGTEELGSIVSALVDLREALRSAKPSSYAAEVEVANQKLISLEEQVVDKMGELAAKMVRMETVKSHDEEYYMELNERVSRDLDVDVSEAIMRLMQASTSYQAALQVGAQIMNTSLLNYL
jgi:flagellin-like hook-associated protein FlgL